MKLLSEDPDNYKDAPTEGIRRVLAAELHKPMPRDTAVDTSNILSIRMGTTVRPKHSRLHQACQFCVG
jgi:5-oxoprolinase (ATP-hydrolysing)